MAPSLNLDRPVSPMVFEEAYLLTPVHDDFSLPIKTIVYSVKCELRSSIAEKKAEEAANRGHGLPQTLQVFLLPCQLGPRFASKHTACGSSQ